MSIPAIKGFNRNLTCRDFQFVVGETYTHDGPVKACESGFHAIEGFPLDVFEYYPPSTSVYHRVMADGAIGRHTDDSKIAAEILTVGTEVGLSQLIINAVNWVIAKAKSENTDHATGDQGAAISTGNQGAASSTGYKGAASSTGYKGAASSTGNQGAASSTGYQGAADADNGSSAMTNGYDGKVMGRSDGCSLYAAERESLYPNALISNACGITGRDGIEAGVWYKAVAGKLVSA